MPKKTDVLERASVFSAFHVGIFTTMNSRFKIILACIVVGVGAAVFATTLMHSFIYASDDSSDFYASTTEPVISNRAKPAQLVIPALNIDAPVEAVGVSSDGAMATPKKSADVGWYKYGTVPGDIGSAVIDGHVDNTFAFPGIFREIKKLQKGDDVYIDTVLGERLHFIVEDIRTYPYKSVPTKELFELKDAARLNLITCGGTWIQSEKTYDHRIVVYTRLADK